MQDCAQNAHKHFKPCPLFFHLRQSWKVFSEKKKRVVMLANRPVYDRK